MDSKHWKVSEMKKLLYSPPALIFYSITSIILLYLFLPLFNILIFPFNLIGLIFALVGLFINGMLLKKGYCFPGGHAGEDLLRKPSVRQEPPCKCYTHLQVPGNSR